MSYRIETVLESASGKREVRISDLAPGGCYIESIINVTQGETVSFSVMSSAGGQIKFTGEVAYIFPGNGFGVKFTELTDEQREFIDQIISSTSV